MSSPTRTIIIATVLVVSCAIITGFSLSVAATLRTQLLLVQGGYNVRGPAERDARVVSVDVEKRRILLEVSGESIYIPRKLLVTVSPETKLASVKTRFEGDIVVGFDTRTPIQLQDIKVGSSIFVRVAVQADGSIHLIDGIVGLPFANP